MARLKRRFVDGEYGQIHLRIARPENPDFPPLICLHMFPQSGRNFVKFLEKAGNDRIVVALDFPGYGESDAPSTPITAEEYAASVWQVVDQLQLTQQFGQVDLFGIHAGSKLAVEAACQKPELVRKLVLSSSAILAADELADLRESLAHIPIDEDGTRFKSLWKMLVASRDAQTTLEMAATGLAEILRGGESYDWGHNAVFEYNARFAERLASLGHQILFLNPNDGLYEMTPRSLEYAKNGALLNKPDWGLSFIETHAGEAASIIKAFLDNGSVDAPGNTGAEMAK